MSVHLTTQKIIKEWTDYNNHMNVAYYVLIFDVHGAEVLMNKFKTRNIIKSISKSNFIIISPLEMKAFTKSNNKKYSIAITIFQKL